MTPHIEAKKEQIAKTVIMPGDPLRAKLIAELYLDNAELVNSVRGIYAYTGNYKGKRITIMASGMGNPSMGIYSYELFHFYNVDHIIRIGTAGAYVNSLNLKDLVLAKDSYSESSYALVQNGNTEKQIPSSNYLNTIIQKTADSLGIPLHFDSIYCSDVLYAETEDKEEISTVHHCVAVEMESFALFHNAKRLQKHATCILSISNSFVLSGELSAEERQNSLDNMFILALESTLLID